MSGLSVTILGCGSSTGVPRIGNDWGFCDPAEPKNRRTRCSALVEKGGTAVLIDTAPDLREQLLRAGTRRLDGVLFTHEHADQAHGIDDLRTIAYLMRRRVDIFADERCLATLQKRFDYCFETPAGSSYPPILKSHCIKPGDVIRLGEGEDQIEAIGFEQDHGDLVSLGFRIGDFAYSADVVRLDEAAFAALEGVKTWVVDALRPNPHPTHSHVEQTIGWIKKLNVSRGILTNLHIDLDYETLKAQLPAGIEPAYDGMIIEA